MAGSSFSRRQFGLLAAGTAAAWPGSLDRAWAEGTYPDRPIKVVIGFPAGSGADILGRYFTNKLEGLAKQPVVVDNKAGANSNIALRFVQRAEPDGYTVLFVADSNMAGSRYLFKELPFDTLKDFKPIASFAQITFVLVVGPHSPVKTIAELVARLKARKDNIYGYTNQTAQLSTELFKQMTGAPASPVSYKTAPETMKDLTDGTLEFVIMDGTYAAGQVRQGLLKALAVTTATHSPTFPGVPTMAEAGLPGFEFAPWWCAYLPAAAPQAIADKIEGWFHQIAKMPETAKFLATIGAIVNDDGGKAADARLRAELPKWASLVKAAGIVPQ
jgi:tripartite-type tricarboxylate transporter receptor subunit TctC